GGAPCPATQCQAIQEFKYDAGTKQISAVTPPLFPSSPNLAACQPFSTSPVGVGAQYDHQGNLWVMHEGYGGGPVGLWRTNGSGSRNPLTGTCGIAHSSGYGYPCALDGEVGHVPPAVNILEDAPTGTMYVIGFGGQVVPITRSSTASGEPFTMQPEIDLDP